VAVRQLDHALDVAAGTQDAILGGLVRLAHARDDALADLTDLVEHGHGESLPQA
jgi:hypothetical protein